MTDPRDQERAITPIAAGAEITFTNSSRDAQTLFCDGMHGISVQPHVTRLNFFEQYTEAATPGQMFGKYVVTLVIPNDQFVNIVKLLGGVLEDVRAGSIPPLAPHMSDDDE